MSTLELPSKISSGLTPRRRQAHAGECDLWSHYGVTSDKGKRSCWEKVRERSGEGAENEPGGVTSVLLGGVKERASGQAEPSGGSERVLKKSRILGHWEEVIKEGRLASEGGPRGG